MGPLYNFMDWKTNILDFTSLTLLVSRATLGLRPGTGRPAFANLMKYFCTLLETLNTEHLIHYTSSIGKIYDNNMSHRCDLVSVEHTQQKVATATTYNHHEFIKSSGVVVT